jgi:ABC-2 type transport system ATP-binding protein
MAGEQTQPAILAEGLIKRFGKTLALDGLDLEVAAGTVFGLLGPNGAGKTTAVRIFTTLLEPDGGRAQVAGLDCVKDANRLRSRIGLAGQYAAVDALLTGRENLEMVGRLYRLSRAHARARAAELLEQFDLTDAANRTAKTYSGGMRRRLDLAASLIATPPVLFLDEPTTGLDPSGRLAMWERISVLRSEGTTLLLTTQYLEEADRLADRIAVIDRGAIVAQGTATELKATVAGQRLDLTLAGDGAYRTLAARLGARAVTRDPHARTLGVATDGDAAAVRGLLDELDPDEDLVVRFAIHTASLDDVFMSLTDHRPTTAESEPVNA